MCLRLTLAAIGFAFPAMAALAQPGPVGNWLTEDHDGVIAIEPCGEALCGRIVGMDEPLDNGVPRKDVIGRPKCGLTILDHATADGPGKWAGEIYNPDDGKSWNSEFFAAVDGTLHFRGYVLTPLFGETQIWTRWDGALHPDCSMNQSAGN
jgi:uncharacterized protein (DUF2147 family)